MNSGSDHIGQSIRKLRDAKKLSISQVAQRARLAKSTLSYWESGARTPLIAELERVLDVLDASKSVRVSILGLVDSARSVRRLRDMAEADQPVSGDLLRAMRLRKAWSQERLASAANVRQSTIAKWERGEAWPSAEALQTICFCLDATTAELEALTRGRTLGSSRTEAPTYQSCIDQFWTAMYYGRAETRDLIYLCLEADLWRAADQHDWAKPLLCEVYGRHAQYLADEGRMEEARSAASSAIRISRSLRGNLDRFTPATLAHAKATVAATNGRLVDAISMLHDWVGAVQQPEYKAWLLSELAEYYSLRRNNYEAVEMSQSACDEASKCENLSELPNRRLNYAQCLIRIGRTDEAVRLLPKLGAPSSACHFNEAYIHGQAALALGRAECAQEWGLSMTRFAETGGSARDRHLAASFACAL